MPRELPLYCKVFHACSRLLCSGGTNLLDTLADLQGIPRELALSALKLLEPKGKARWVIKVQGTHAQSA